MGMFSHIKIYYGGQVETKLRIFSHVLLIPPALRGYRSNVYICFYPYFISE